jgi:hypothetical protein
MAFRGRGGFSSRGFSSRGFGSRGFNRGGFGSRFDNGRGYDDYYDDGGDYYMGGGRGGGRGFSRGGGGFRGRGGYYDDYSGFQRSDRGRFRLDFTRREANKPDMATTELFTKTLFIQSKKFYVDVKENKRGKFVRISEVAPNGQRMRLILDLPDAAEFHEKLTELCEVYSNLGPEKSHQGYESEEKIKSDSIFRDDKRYFLDLKENHRGRFLKVSMTLPNNDRSQIVIPAHGMVEIRDALTDILNEFGREESKPAVSKGDPENTIEMENNKSIYIETGSNMRGTYMRINEVTGAFRACVTVAEDCWPEFLALVEDAISTTVVEETIKDEGNESARMEEGDE